MRAALLFLTIWIAGFTCAQIVDVSPPTRLSSKVQRVRIVGKNSDGYIVRFSGEEEAVHVYSNELRLVAAKTIDFKGMDGEVQHILLNKTGASVLYLEGDKRQTSLLAQPVNSKFIENGKPLLIDSFYDRPDLVNANLHFRISFDQNYMLFYYPIFRGGIIEKMQLTCIDRGLNVIYRTFVPINRPEKDMEYARTLVDNAGNGYLIFAAEPNGKDRTYGDAFSVVRIDRYDGTLLNFELRCEKEIFGEPLFEFDNANNAIQFSGFYDEKGTAADPAASGFFYHQYDAKDGRPKQQLYTPFPSEFIKELTGREATPMNSKLYTFAMKKVVPRIDGGLFFAAESFIKDHREVLTMTPSMMTPYNSYRTITTYSYNDIITFSLQPNGSIEWDNILRKKQNSEEDNGFNSSFALMNQKDQLRFIFLEDVSAGASVNEYVLTSNGKSVRNNLFNQEDKDVLLIPRLAKQVTPDEILLPSTKGNVFRLVKITY
ncbi:MAG: hypothetical protein U0T73_06205 [Chitinophagales bacterium]